MLANSESTIVINGDKHLAGRLCSVVAKMLLNGNRVVLVNAEKILISGSRANILKENELRLEITSRVHPKHGPFHPRRPDTYIEGNAAKKLLRVYISVPEKYQKAEQKTIETALAPRSLSYYTTIGELCSSMGWRKLE